MIVATIIGARPQFIKAAVVSPAFCEHHSDVQEVIVHTGQHYDADMSDIFLENWISLAQALSQQSSTSRRHKREQRGFILFTLHRAETTDKPERLANIISALNEVIVTTPVILPLHPRPANCSVKVISMFLISRCLPL